LNGVIRSFDLSKASVHDVYYLKDVKELYQDCVLSGDGSYLSTECQLELFENCRQYSGFLAWRMLLSRSFGSAGYKPVSCGKIRNFFARNGGGFG
jgi:hypothetical protein